MNTLGDPTSKRQENTITNHTYKTEYKQRKPILSLSRWDDVHARKDTKSYIAKLGLNTIFPSPCIQWKQQKKCSKNNRNTALKRTALIGMGLNIFNLPICSMFSRCCVACTAHALFSLNVSLQRNSKIERSYS